MNGISFPVIHPSFRNLQRNGRFLHIIAAGLILLHAIGHLRQPEPNFFYLACLVLIAADILILVFAVRNALTDLPIVNLIFRFIEFLFFLGIGVELFLKGQWAMGGLHITISLAYVYLFYCEKKLRTAEVLSIHHTGISVPALPESRFLKWTSIHSLKATYHSVTIMTGDRRTYHFDLEQQLQFGELDQIHEFCRHYLGSAAE